MNSEFILFAGANVFSDSDSVANEAPFLNVTIVYDDIPAGQNAIRVLSKTSNLLQDDVALRPQLWRSQFLEEPEWYARSLIDAINADILIITASASTQPDRLLERWLELCMTGKRGRDSAVVALLGPAEKPDRWDSPRFRFVQRVTEEAGLDFFAPGATSAEAGQSASGEESRSSPAQQSLTERGVACGYPRVLCVEDDPLQRRLCALILTRAGYEVTAAESAFQGWEALNSGEYDLLVTDNEMPQFTGLELVMKARVAGMKLPIIIASGAASNLGKPEYDWLQLAARIQKPFTLNQLVDAVARVLGKTTETATPDPGDSSRHFPMGLRRFAPDEDWGINE